MKNNLSNTPVALANDNYDVRGKAGTFSAETEDAVDAAHKASAAAHKAGTKAGHERAARMHRLAGHTVAEIIHARADSKKPNMGLTNWRGAKVRKEDVSIAKNYLNEPELAALNNLVEQYLVFAEGQAMRRVPMHMKDWITKLHAFLTINDRHILTHAGKISHRMAKELAETECEKFSRQRIRQADAAGGEFEKAIKQLPPPPKPKKKGGKK